MFGRRLKEIIDLKGITVYSLAKGASINKQTIANYIKGVNTPSIEKAIAIANYIGVTLDWLFTGKGEMIENIHIEGDNSGISNTGTISGNVNNGSVGGNVVSVSLPEKGTSKIIKPDGTTEIWHDEPGENAQRFDLVLAEITKLRDENYRLRENVDSLNKKIIELYEKLLSQSNNG